jgi:hypothetical protein
MSNEIFQIGLSGIQRGLAGVAEKAERITRAFLPDSNEEPSDAIIGIKLDEFQTKASAKVIKTAEELQDSVLDILA